MDSTAVHPIRAARFKKGLSQAELGALIGVSKAAVSAWENNREAPDSRRLAGLARALKPALRMDQLLAHLERPGQAA